MAIASAALVAVHILLISRVQCDTFFMNIQEIDNTPVQGAVGQVVPVVNVIECAVLCEMSVQCDAIYYNHSTHQCVTVYDQIHDPKISNGLNGIYLKTKGFKTCRINGYQYAWELDICLNFRYESQTKVDWNSAKAKCQSESGNLIVVDSEFKDKLFLKYLQDIFDYVHVQRWWIGATDMETEGTFKWVNGKEVTYDNWNTGQPDNFNSQTSVANANCAQYFHSSTKNIFHWYDITCNQTLAFVCENREFI